MTKTRRMRNIFAADGRSITLALDGHYFSTNTHGIDETIGELPKMIESGLNAVLVTYGMAKAYADFFSGVGMLIRADLSTGVMDSSVPNTMGVTTVEDALKLGADGIISMTFPGAPNEASSHQIARELAREADRWNMPFMCESLPFGYAITNEESNLPGVIASGARLGAELGADIIKTRFTGSEGDSEIVKRVNCPVLALGGPKTEHIFDYLTFVRHCMDVGAKGVAVGRNITQDKHPASVVAALNVLIHQNGTAEEALETYQTF